MDRVCISCEFHISGVQKVVGALRTADLSLLFRPRCIMNAWVYGKGTDSLCLCDKLILITRTASPRRHNGMFHAAALIDRSKETEGGETNNMCD